MTNQEQTKTNEKGFSAISGWLMLALWPAALAGVVYLFVAAAQRSQPDPWLISGSIAGVLVLIIWLIGFFIVNPNQSRVLVLFGRYRGSVRKNGFYWVNPFTICRKVSLRARNFNTDTLKVNDKGGNPIEIAAIVVWIVRDTAHAVFDVDDYEDYVATQSEAAIRVLASKYDYDGHDDGEALSLRGSREEIAVELVRELEERLERAGIEVVEARLSHLAYAPEIAGAMLKRQQAHAIIAARQKIVDGAVGMVQMALDGLKERGVVDLDEERRAAMVSNLLVVLCSEQGTQPVLNTGTLYN